jgi:altronate hydrolase
VLLAETIPLGHKFSVEPIEVGQPVRKYGQVIGHATSTMSVGVWVHTQNLALQEFEREYARAQHVPPDPPAITDRTFRGYRRASGRVGTRNYIAIISTVNCSASVSKYIARRFDTDQLRDYPNVDGVVAFTHAGGCGLQFAGTAHQMLNRVLAGIARHPNIGAYLLVGLGCEQAGMEYLLEQEKLVQIAGSRPVAGSPTVFSMQDQGGTRRTVEAGVCKVEEMLPLVNEARRVEVPASEIVLATECGGSDGSSGITANPALGVAADRVVACGGTAILGETSEIFGAEHLLTRRARSVEVADKLLERIAWWRWYTGLFDVHLDNNPSLGNKEGGLTTIAEKSLGAVAKAGSTALVDVLQYAEPVSAKGMVIMDTPGYDPASVTGMVAGGANVVAFTTGRGSCFGCKPAPTIKLATNTPMFQRMEEDMDIDAGPILNGTSVHEVGEQIFDFVLEVASGRKTKSELQGIGDEEFVPWTVGPTL